MANKQLKIKLLRRQANFSLFKVLAFALLFSLAGGYILWRSLAATPSSSASLTLPKVGVSIGATSGIRPQADITFEWDNIKAIGAKFVRVDAGPWAVSNGALDRYVKEASVRGLDLMFNVGGSMTPTTSNPLWGGIPTPQSYANYAVSLVNKYPQVHSWELMNEPDPRWTPATYTQFANAAYSAIKAASPNAYVIVGAVSISNGATAGFQWAKSAYQAGLAGHFDAFSIHGSDDPTVHASWSMFSWAFGPKDSTITDTLRDVLDRGGDQGKPIIVSEYDIPPIPKYNEAAQADGTSKAILDTRWPVVAVYTMLDDDVPGFGLLRPDRTQRPAWTAFQQATASLSGTASGDINGDGHVNILDLSILLSKYGSTNTGADLNHDGIVNIADLSTLLSHYGS